MTYKFTDTELLTYILGVKAALNPEPICRTYTGYLYFVEIPYWQEMGVEIYTTVDGMIKFFTIFHIDIDTTLSCFRVSRDVHRHFKAEAISETVFKTEASELMGFRI